MAETWYMIGGRVMGFKSRPLLFRIETIDGNPYTINFAGDGSATFNSGENAIYMYSGYDSHPSFNFDNPLNIKSFVSSDTLYIDNANIGWINIQRIDADGLMTGNFDGISTLTSINYLYLNSNSFTGDMTGVSGLTSLTYLRLQGNSFTGDMAGVSGLTLLNYLYLRSTGFTGNIAGVVNLTSLGTLYLIGNRFTGDMSGVYNLTSLTLLYLDEAGLTGNMSGVSGLTLLTTLRLESNGFTLTYSTFTANLQALFLRLQTGELSNPADIDQLFIDLDAVATTKTGSFDVRSAGAAAPTAASEAARDSLVSKGRTILTN